MNEFAVIRLVCSILCLLGGLCMYMGVRSAPRSIKMDQFTLMFEPPEDPSTDFGERLVIIHARKLAPFLAIVWLCGLSYCIYALSRDGILPPHAVPYWAYQIPVAAGIALNLHRISLHLQLYDNVFVVRSLLWRRVYQLDDADTLESYNVVGAFNKGKSFGYRLKKSGRVLCRFDNRRYRKLERIEEIWEDSYFEEPAPNSEAAIAEHAGAAPEDVKPPAATDTESVPDAPLTGQEPPIPVEEPVPEPDPAEEPLPAGTAVGAPSPPEVSQPAAAITPGPAPAIPAMAAPPIGATGPMPAITPAAMPFAAQE